MITGLHFAEVGLEADVDLAYVFFPEPTFQSEHTVIGLAEWQFSKVNDCFADSIPQAKIVVKDFDFLNIVWQNFESELFIPNRVYSHRFCG